jgi:hypothetical protein
MGLDSPSFWLSFFGIRVTSELFYFITPAWWYIGLLIQLYLIYPFLWKLLQRLGPGRFLIVILPLAFLVRGAGLFLFTNYLDAWSRGSIFITRLPEFALGMALARLLQTRGEVVMAVVRSFRFIALSVLVYIVSVGLSLTLGGMSVAIFFLGASAFFILIPILTSLSRSNGVAVRALTFVGDHSFSLYLVHGIVVSALFPIGYTASLGVTALRMAAALLVSVLLGVMLERITDALVKRISVWRQRAGVRGVFFRSAIIVSAGLVLLLCVEVGFRTYNPQEVLGWGERPSLQPDEYFGWKLIPSKTTRLRWEHYDYVVTSNSLGFPGPEYTHVRRPRSLRLLLTGDAFTSAEGVDTDSSWGMRLVPELQSRFPQTAIEVANFAMTGYGPRQYEAIVDSFVPLLKPDLVIVETFVNDFQDAVTTDAEFRQSIGFDNPSPESWHALARLSHLQTFLRLNVLSPLIASLGSRPSPPYGYFLGNIPALERGNAAISGEGKLRMKGNLQAIQRVARANGAPVLLVMVPASVQVCAPGDLHYFPSRVDLSDTSRYDLDQPQRVIGEIADSLGLARIDLRAVLRSTSGTCYYHPRNMHWTAAGHCRVAQYVAAVIAKHFSHEEESGTR